MIDALFGSKTRVKLLHLFLNNPNRSFYVREITRKIDEQINSVRRELANMLTVGIIRSDTANNRLYYEVNQKYPFYEPFRAIFADGSTAVKAASEVESSDWGSKLKLLGDVRLAILSGKLVRGSSSDVDVMIAGDVNKAQLKKFISEIEEDENIQINYTVLSYEDFYYRLSIKDRFISEILNNKYALLRDAENILSGDKNKKG